MSDIIQIKLRAIQFCQLRLKRIGQKGYAYVDSRY
jgi:hypothetical protein